VLVMPAAGGTISRQFTVLLPGGSAW
jgi:hypothetical protein